MSTLRLLQHYQQERLPSRLYLPLACLLCTGAIAGGRPVLVPDVALGLLLAYTLMFQFRLWDDLADLPQDRDTNPDRLLCMTSALSPFYVTEIALFSLNLALIAWSSAGWQRPAVLVLLTGAFALWYQLRGRLGLSLIAAAHISLLKYPVFVYLLSTPPAADNDMPLLLSLILIYLCFSIYEILHDERLQSFAARSILATEMMALGVITILMAITPLAHGGASALIQWILVAIGAGALFVLFQRQRARLGPTAWNYGIFVLGFAHSVAFSLGLSS